MRGDSSSRVFFGVDAIIAGCHGKGGGCGCGRGHDLEGERGHRDKGLCHCINCGRNNHTSYKCWNKFGKPEWAQVNSTSTSTSTAITYSAASTIRIF